LFIACLKPIVASIAHITALRAVKENINRALDHLADLPDRDTWRIALVNP
jgi:hypothetical protein